MGLHGSILIVENEALIGQAWSILLEDMGLEICGIAATADTALSLAQRHRPSLVLMDVKLQNDTDGIEVACAIHSLVGSRIIFVTGSDELETAGRFNLNYAAAVLFKPVTAWQIELAITTALALEPEPLTGPGSRE